MGNIYIVGAPRSGKSTLARMISAKQPEINLISFEAVRNGFIKSQPELDMGNRESAARREILPEFVFEFLQWNEKMTGRPNLMEGSFMQVEDLVKHVRDDDRIICLGFGGRKLAEVAKQVLVHTKEGDYLYGCSEEKFCQHFYDLEENDWVNMEFCQKNGIKYYDTFENREEVLREI